MTFHKKFDLRWRFEFTGNRPAKYGKWSSPGNSPELQAWNKNKEGVARACIEGKDVETGASCVLVDIPGQDFVNFQWIASASTPGMFNGSIRPVHQLLGLKIVARDTEISVMADGAVYENKRAEDEKTINFATFGR